MKAFFRNGVLAVLAGLVALLAGCAAPMGAMVAVPMQNRTGAAEQAFKGYGPATITGQAFLRQRGGGVVTCGGMPVLIVPATAYFREMFEINHRGESPIGGQAAVGEFGIKTTCDAQGNFTFDRIQKGEWIVSVMVNWQAGGERQGGLLLKEATASETPARVLLSDADFFSR